MYYIEKSRDDLLFHTVQGDFQMRGSIFRCVRRRYWYSCFCPGDGGRLLTPYGNETFMLPYVFVYIGYALAVGLAIWLAFDAAWLEIVFVVAAGYATEHMCSRCPEWDFIC